MPRSGGVARVAEQDALAGSATRLSSPALIGREQELAALLATVLRPPAVAVVAGEPGVGKTRLVRELLARPELEGARALVGHCQPLREPFPFGPAVEALRSAAALPPASDLNAVCGALRPLVPELAEGLPPALEPLGDARASRHRILRAIVELVRSLGPTVLVLEDVHWSDDGTDDLLRVLVSQLPEETSLVLTYRREDLAPTSPLPNLTSRLPPEISRTRIWLSPLGPDHVRELVGSILDVDEVSPEFALYLHERTLGLPFAIEEVVRLLADRRDLVEMDGRWVGRVLDELEVPAAIQDLTLGRLAALSPDARQVTQAAAVVGTPASAELLARVTRLSRERTARGLAEALSLALLRETEGGRLALRHVLAQRALYDAMPTPERRLLHLRTAQTLKESSPDPPLAQIAHHLKCGGTPRKWLPYAEAAADLAISLGNDSAACDLLVEALESGEAPHSARARLAVKLGRAALGSLDHDQATAVLRRVLHEEDLPAGVRGEVRLYVGLLLDNQAGQASAGLAEIRRAVPELRRRPGLAARAMSVLAIPMSTTGDLREHLGWMNRALAAADRARDPVLRTAVLVNRATVLMHVGDPAAWEAVRAVPKDAGSAEETRQLLRANANLAHACTCTGHYATAESFLARAYELLAETSDPYLAASLESTSVLLDWTLGRWEGLEARARRLSRSLEDAPLVFAEAELVLGLLQLARGELLAAKAHLESAREVGSTGGSVPVVVAAAGGSSRLLLARGDAEGAADVTLSALELVMRKRVWVWATEAAPGAVEALVAVGRREQATSLVAEIGAGLRGRDAPAAQAALAVCRALLEQTADAHLLAERACLELPRPYEAARAREALGVHLLAAGDEGGKNALTAALESLKALGAAWDAARVRRSLREHGVLRPWKGGRRGYGSRLSPREEEVVKLAAEGHTNREIAEALVLSPRTVETHVAKGMRKLGVRSRKALAGALEH